MFKSGSVIIMALCKMYLEANTLVLVCMDMTPLLIMMKGLLLIITQMRRDIKDLYIPLR